MRRHDNRWTIRVTEWIPRGHKRPQGWPRMRWCNDWIRYVGPMWSYIAKDRKLWRAFRKGFLLRERETPWLMMMMTIIIVIIIVVIVIIIINLVWHIMIYDKSTWRKTTMVWTRLEKRQPVCWQESVEFESWNKRERETKDQMERLCGGRHARGRCSTKRCRREVGVEKKDSHRQPWLGQE